MSLLSWQVVPANHNGANPASVKAGHLLSLRTVPLSFTCGTRGTCLIADPTVDEESLLHTQATVVLDQDGTILGEIAKFLCDLDAIV